MQDTCLLKRCTICQQEYPATNEYFHRCKKGKYGLDSRCKTCMIERDKEHNKAYRSRPEWQGQKRIYDKAYKQRYEQRTGVSFWIGYRQQPEVRERRNVLQKLWRSQPDVQERGRAHVRNRRARKKAATGKHTSQDIQAQYEWQKGKCYYCEEKLTKYHVDHVIPLARGGSNDPSNLVIACQHCNDSKRDSLWRLL